MFRQRLNLSSRYECCASLRHIGDIDRDVAASVQKNAPETGHAFGLRSRSTLSMRFDLGRTGSYHGTPMDAKSFGSIIRQWRIEADISQTELGDRSGLSRKIIYGIEKGRHRFDPKKVVLLCRALDRSVDELARVWSHHFLEQIQETERGMLGSERVLPQPAPGAESPLQRPEPSVSSPFEEEIDAIAARVKETFQKHQAETLARVEKLLAQAGYILPTLSTTARRPRSRVSRKGRVKTKTDSSRRS